MQGNHDARVLLYMHEYENLTVARATPQTHIARVQHKPTQLPKISTESCGPHPTRLIMPN